MTEALKIKEIAGQAGRQNDCRIYDIFKHRDRLQIFIEKKSKGAPVSLQDCENVFHSLQFLLRSELPHILENRRLEVSSPGIERQLREKWHFEESIGKTLKLTATGPVEAQSAKTGKSFCAQSFTARLTSISKDSLSLKSQAMECSVPFSKIKRARWVFKADKPLKRAGGKNKKSKNRGKHVS